MKLLKTDKMKEIIELEKYKHSDIIINSDLNRYESYVSCSEKLSEANEILEKYGLPDGWTQKTDRNISSAFWMNGILKSADANANIFLIISIDNGKSSNYAIHTVPETLNKLVKTFWDEPIKVHIRPQIDATNLFQYELIEVKVD